MSKIGLGIAAMFLGVMTACAVESDAPSTPPASSSTSEVSADLLPKPGPRPELCISFYQGAGNYYQCASTEEWFHGGGGSQCVENCPEHACSLDVICGSGGSCDCHGN